MKGPLRKPWERVPDPQKGGVMPTAGSGLWLREEFKSLSALASRPRWSCPCALNVLARKYLSASACGGYFLFRDSFFQVPALAHYLPELPCLLNQAVFNQELIMRLANFNRELTMHQGLCYLSILHVTDASEQWKAYYPH